MTVTCTTVPTFNSILTFYQVIVDLNKTAYFLSTWNDHIYLLMSIPLYKDNRFYCCSKPTNIDKNCGQKTMNFSEKAKWASTADKNLSAKINWCSSWKAFAATRFTTHQMLLLLLLPVNQLQSRTLLLEYPNKVMAFLTYILSQK